MMKNECEIVKDLFPSYIENQVSNQTREFVDEHIKGCKDCNKILSSLKRKSKCSCGN